MAIKKINYLIALIIAALGLLSISVLHFPFHNTKNIMEQTVVLQEKVAKVKMKILDSHLRMEELSMGDNSVNYERGVYRKIKDAKEIMESLLFTEKDFFPKIDSEKKIRFKSLIKKTIVGIDLQMELAQRRNELLKLRYNDTKINKNITDASVGSQIEERFDMSNENINKIIDEFLKYTKKIAIENTKEASIKFYLSLIISMLFFLFIVGLQLVTHFKNQKEIVRNKKKLRSAKSRIDKLIDFIDRISEGDYNATLELDTKDDYIAKSIVGMRDKMKKSYELEQKSKKEAEIRNWINTGMSKLSDIIYQSSENLKELSSLIIKNLVQYINANQGGLFILEENNEEDILELVAAYAYDRNKYLQKKVRFGQGLVGACALERKTVYMNDIPEDYISITSGLGIANPRNLLIVPLKLEDRIFGVVEIATFNRLKDYEIQFVEQAAENIASVLSTVKVNIRTAELLKLSKIQAEEKALQEEELRQNMEEMQAIQEEQDRKKLEIQGIMNAIDNSVMGIEFSLNGDLLTANQNFMKNFGYKLSELKKMKAGDFVSEEEKKGFDKIWLQLCFGNKYKAIVKRKTKLNENIWLVVTYTPVEGRYGDIDKILMFANDITEQKEKEIAATNELNEIKTYQKQLIENKKQYEINLKRRKEAENEIKKITKEIELKEKEVKEIKEELKQTKIMLKEKSIEIDKKNRMLKQKTNFINKLKNE